VHKSGRNPQQHLHYCHQVKLFNEKKADLEEQQLHLNVGLQKIRETVEQVEELQKSLSIKRNELEEKNNMANAKLKQMVSGVIVFRMKISVNRTKSNRSILTFIVVIY